LDQSVNNTSVMMVLEINGTHLLLPGDAQMGSWKAALKDPEWQKLFERTRFLKVGHHGSHNATPRALVERYLRGTGGRFAMVSVHPHSRYRDVPRKPLLDALAKDGGAVVVRSDARSVPKPYINNATGWVDLVLKTSAVPAIITSRRSRRHPRAPRRPSVAPFGVATHISRIVALVDNEDERSLMIRIGALSQPAGGARSFSFDATSPNAPPTQGREANMFERAGRRIFERWAREAHALICGNDREDAEDRRKILEAFGVGETAVVVALTTALASLGLSVAVAGIISGLVVKRFFNPAVEEMCAIWGAALTK
jgi:hypothetical protein